MEAPLNIQNHRREQCDRCTTPCQYWDSDSFRKEGDNVCPKRRWMAYQTHHRWTGAGDMVASVAQPIAGVIDKVAAKVGIRTNVRGCGACQRRKELLNTYLPFPSNRR